MSSIRTARATSPDAAAAVAAGVSPRSSHRAPPDAATSPDAPRRALPVGATSPRSLQRTSARASVLGVDARRSSASAASSSPPVQSSSSSLSVAAAAAEARPVSPLPPWPLPTAPQAEVHASARAAFDDAVSKLRPVVSPDILEHLLGYVYELRSELRSATDLIDSMLSAQDQLSVEAKAELQKLAEVAADRIIMTENQVQTWQRRANKMRSSAESLKCAVCLERQRNVVVKPCAHLAMCSECCGKMRTQACPLCGLPSTSVDIVFIP